MLSTILKLVIILLSFPEFSKAQFANQSFWRNRVTYLSFSTATQSIYSGNCSGVVTLQTKNSKGTAFNVASNLTVNLSGPGAATFYSDSTCTNAVTSVTVASGTSSTNFYFIVTTTGSANITADATNFTSATQSETLSTNPYVWTGGGGDANWNTAANWSGGSAPGAGNLALFNSTCASNCSPSINVSISVAGVQMATGYAGTITQGAANTITLGTKGWSQLSGTFVGNNGAITSSGAVAIAGGSFTSTSGLFNVSGPWAIRNSPTFTHNSGTLSLNSGGTISPGSVQYNNVSFPSFNVIYDFGGGTMTILGNLVLAATSSSPPSRLNSGTLNVAGNVTVTNFGASGDAVIRLTGNAAGQVVTASANGFTNLTIDTGTNNVTLSGSLRIGGNYIVTSVGTLTTTGSTLTFHNNQGAVTLSPGSTHYNNIVLGGFTGSYNLGGATFYVDGDLTFNSTSSSPPTSLNSGTLAVKGNLTTSASNYGIIGNAQLQFVGTSNQTITIAAGSSLPNGNVTVAMTAGMTLTQASAVSWNNVGQTLSVTSGGIDMAGFALTAKALSLNSNTLTKGGGVLTVNGSVAGTGALFGGTVAP